MFRLIPLFMAVAFASSIAADDPGRQPLRTWSDNTGTFTVRASLVDVDAAAQTLTLKLATGENVQLPIRRLSVEDREYLDAVAGEATAPPETVEIAGVNWFEDFQEAKQVAAGKATPRDDKPMMCFRVLGELDGFM